MPIDLRSDTVTRPTAAMRAAMFDAPLGDDVFDDDPTVHRLQHHAAAMFQKEAALFFPTGTQSNLAALMAHCERGDEFLVGHSAHTYRYEAGGAAVLGSIQPQPIPHQPDGTLALDDIEAAIKPDDIHFARTRLLALENTLGGRAMPLAWTRAATALARRHGLSTHLDGARVFNASIALNQPVTALCADFDTVSVCLSKGLGAPAGTVLVGDRARIARARRARKMLGGGMRQVGFLAAAGLFALQHHVERLRVDHDHAQRLADGLRAVPWLHDVAAHTNMVFVRPDPAVLPGLQDRLAETGVLARIGAQTRLVTHLDVSSDQIDAAITAFHHAAG
jgi:threonine aldolase